MSCLFVDTRRYYDFLEGDVLSFALMVNLEFISAGLPYERYSSVILL